MVRYDNPDLDGKDALVGKRVYQLEREPLPHLGEAVSFDTGKIAFRLSGVESTLIAEIKAAAAAKIAEVAPTWRQLNDLANPDEPGAVERRAQVNAIRSWSNELEASLSSAQSPSDIAAIREILLNL